MELGRWRDAEEVYRKALAIDPDNVHGYMGLSRIALRRRRYAEAAQAALDALQRIHHYPMAHFLLGAALERLGEYDRAASALASIHDRPAKLATVNQKRIGRGESESSAFNSRAAASRSSQ
jgi:tetratricopeptide (TPR) repeat protein